MPTHIMLDPTDPKGPILTVYDLGTSVSAQTPTVSVRSPTDQSETIWWEVLRNLGGGWLTTVLSVVAQAAYSTGRSSAGADPLEVVLTPAIYTNPRAPGEWLGAAALLHYADEKGRPVCGLGPRVNGYTGAANVLAAILDGAAPCPECLALHREGVRQQAAEREAATSQDDQLVLPEVK